MYCDHPLLLSLLCKYIYFKKTQISLASANNVAIQTCVICPNRESVHIKHDATIGVEAEEGGEHGDDVEDDAHPQHVLDAKTLSSSSVNDGVAGGGDWQHEGVAGGQRHPQGQVQGVDVEGGGHREDHGHKHGGGGCVGGYL